ncbi:MAG: KH domain-containing protein [Candidatus Sumerlaeaceae bacterium]|nr:KH domain-containing protein [Candidatus Sumerlaeaceae bacterium]
MIEQSVSGASYEEALEEGLKLWGVSQEFVEVEVQSDAHEDTLPGAAPLEGVTLRMRLKSEEIISRACQHVKRILELIGIEASLEVQNRQRGVAINIIAGEDGALVIGKNGQNIEALQYLINRMVLGNNRDLLPITVDSEGYKEKHLAKLEDLAHKIASRVQRQRREFALKPMSPADRRIIHMTLKEVRSVHTISRGEEGDRHVVITPAKGAMQSGQRQGGRFGGGQRGGQRGGGGGRRYDGDRNQSQRPSRGYQGGITPRDLPDNAGNRNPGHDDYDDNFGNR